MLGAVKALAAMPECKDDSTNDTAPFAHDDLGVDK